MMLPLVNTIPKDVIMIYDRGFCGYALPFLHYYYGSHCIIRLTSKFNPLVEAFIQSGKRQQQICAPMTERAVRALRKLGFQVSRKNLIRYRLIRVDLPDGQVEVLMTTLLNNRLWPAKEFKALYAARWGVETGFFLIKSYFQAAVFSSYNVPGVEQELWATFALFNIQTASQRPLKRALKTLSRHRKYFYQLNRNVGLGYLKRFLPALILHPLKQLRERLDRLLDTLMHATEPVRPKKNRVRKRRIMRSTERHVYEPNYRPVL